MYNNKIYQNPLNNHLFKQITIDGREAIIETSKTGMKGLHVFIFQKQIL